MKCERFRDLYMSGPHRQEITRRVTTDVDTTEVIEDTDTFCGSTKRCELLPDPRPRNIRTDFYFERTTAVTAPCGVACPQCVVVHSVEPSLATRLAEVCAGMALPLNATAEPDSVQNTSPRRRRVFTSESGADVVRSPRLPRVLQERARSRRGEE